MKPGKGQNQRMFARSGFGRTLFAQGVSSRDRNPFDFSIWLAGGGVKRGFIDGQTDEFGYYAVENNHQRLTYRFSGRDCRLSDVRGRVVRDLLA